MQKVIQYTIRILIRGMVISFVIAGVFIGLQVLMGRELIWNSSLKQELINYMVYSIVLTFMNNLYFDYLNHRVNWKSLKKWRIVIGAIGSVLITLIGLFLVRLVLFYTLELGDNLNDFIANQHLAFYVTSLLITMVVSLFFHTIHFYKKAQEQEVKEQKVIAGTASAQFESLKNQIDPHFLFNSLNVLSSLIEENPDNAQRFTTSLSKIYRYVLEQKDKELVSVEEELNFAKTYMNLLKMRFENSISYELPSDFHNLEARVVPLSLQLLLENTIKHNVVSEQKPLHIKIYVENNYLIIENNLQKKEVLQDRRGVGLQNIVNRYALVSERKVLVEESAAYFKVWIPILTKQVAFMETQNTYNENLAYERAKERVEKLKGFYGNLISYCFVIPILIVTNLRTSHFHWFWFPLLGWGMGVIFHALEVFGYGQKWEERKIRELLNKEGQHKKWN